MQSIQEEFAELTELSQQGTNDVKNLRQKAEVLVSKADKALARLLREHPEFAAQLAPAIEGLKTAAALLVETVTVQ